MTATRETHVFICEPPWLFALFARHNYRAGGVAEAFTGQHVFLRESDMERDRLIGPGGQPFAADRPLSYFIAHEVMHIANARALGRLAYLRLPQWVNDGYADYVARDIDLAAAWRGLRTGASELGLVKAKGGGARLTPRSAAPAFHFRGLTWASRRCR